MGQSSSGFLLIQISSGNFLQLFSPPMSVAKPETVAELLVLRSGLVFLDEAAADLALNDNQQRGVRREGERSAPVLSRREVAGDARGGLAARPRARRGL
jgi:hypothetical protein